MNNSSARQRWVTINQHIQQLMCAADAGKRGQLASFDLDRKDDRRKQLVIGWRSASRSQLGKRPASLIR